MKHIGMLFLLSVGAAFADVNWYYTIEAPPASVPQIAAPPGILVLIRKPADVVTVCVDSTSADTKSHICRTVQFLQSDLFPYNVVRFDDIAHVDAIAVTVGTVTKSVADPIPGQEY